MATSTDPNQPAKPHLPDPEELAKAFAKIAQTSQSIANEFLTRTATGKTALPTDDLGVGHAFIDLAAKLWANPMQLAETQMQLWQDYFRLWHSSMQRFADCPTANAKPSNCSSSRVSRLPRRPRVPALRPALSKFELTARTWH